MCENCGISEFDKCLQCLEKDLQADKLIEPGILNPYGKPRVYKYKEPTVYSRPYRFKRIKRRTSKKKKVMKKVDCSDTSSISFVVCRTRTCKNYVIPGKTWCPGCKTTPGKVAEAASQALKDTVYDRVSFNHPWVKE